MDPISAIFVVTVLGGLFAKGVDVATDGWFSAEVGAGVRGVAGYAGRDVRDRWGRANEKVREIRSRTRSGRMVQGVLDDAGAFGRAGWMVGRVLFGEARRFGSGARSEWETARDQARSARTERRGDVPWPIVRAARSGAVRAREWAEQRSRSDAGDPNEAEPNVCARCGRAERDDELFGGYGDLRLCDSCVEWLNRRYPEGWPDDPNEVTEFGQGQGRPEQMPDVDQAPFGGPAVVRPFGPDEPRGPNEPIDWDASGAERVRSGLAERAERARMGTRTEPEPIGPVETPGSDAYLPPRPGDPARQPVRVEIYRAYVERGQRDVRARVRRLDTGASHHAVKDHDYRSGERGWTTFHTTPWLPSMAAVVAEVRATVLDDLGRMRVPYRIEWFVDGEPSAQPASHPAEGDPNDPDGDPNVPLPSTVPDADGDVKCGCCARLHKPLPPGEHCPDCHIHDQPTPPNAPTTKGPSMDINSAPAAIAATEAFAPRFESLQSRADSLAGEWDSLKNDADALHREIATLMDGMGDFAIGGEADTAAVVGELSESATSAKEQADNVVGSISTAKEAHAAYVDNLHLEYDASIEAAAGKAADVHSVMQEA